MLALISVALLAAAASAINPLGPHVGAWTHVARSAPETVVPLVSIGVRLNDDAAATCASLLEERSTPGSAKFAEHLAYREVGRLSNATRFARVLTFLRRGGIAASQVRPSPNRDFVRVRGATVAQLEALLGAEFHAYQSRESASLVVHRSTKLALPADMADAIELVTNVQALPAPPSKQRKISSLRAASPKADGNATPQLLSAYYRIKNNTAYSAASVTQSVFESLGQSFSPSDLAMFNSQYNLPNSSVSTVIGPNDPTACSSDPNNCGEANLDVQYMTAIAQQATTWYWSIDQSVSDIFMEWSIEVAARSDAPYVHSISYGSLANEDVHSDMVRFNTEVCKMGLRGLTIVIASGDDGVANFGARSDPTQCGFTPSWPATSPYVLTVGATQGPEYGTPEIACTSATNGLITTGGGFSIYFPRPAWQASVVASYLASGPNMPPLSQFNSTNRGYPDVAMLGHNYPVFIGGTSYQVSGTSASSPVFAALISLVNGMRASVGKKPLGFVTPSIYAIAAANPGVFNDITSGENNCCAGQAGSQTCCQYGFTASAGWDPLTGLGTPKFDLLSKLLAAL